MTDTAPRKDPELPGWNHVPDVPVQASPFFC